MSRAEQYLALCLIDAIEDANIEAMRLLLTKHSANPNTMILRKDVAPMHLVVGAEEMSFAEKATELMIRHGGDANLPTVDQMLTPLHAAASIGRVEIVRLLLKGGGNVEQVDEDERTPIQHAIEEGHFEVVQLIKNYIFERKIEKKRNQLLLEQQLQQLPYQPEQATMSPNMRHRKSYGGFLPVSHTNRFQGSTSAALQMLEERTLTPNKIHYNFDATSPYYVNITHRRKDRFKPHANSASKMLLPAEPAVDEQENFCPTEKNNHEYELLEEKTIVSAIDSNRTNLFELTERNLKNFSRNDVTTTGRRSSFIECWREKIADMRERTSVSRRLDDIDKILNSFSEQLSLKSFMDDVDQTFVTAPEEPENDGEAEFEELHDQTEQEKYRDHVIEENPAPQKEWMIKTSDIHQHETEPHEYRDNLTDNETVIIQISEEFIHTDDEAGVVFREKKMTIPRSFALASHIPTLVPKLQVVSEDGQLVYQNSKETKARCEPPSIGRNPSLTSQSTAVTLPPLDYDTDALRAELTNYGEPPGPITKHTKKLYLRKLIKFRRHPERLAAIERTDAKGQNTVSIFSVELMATVRKEDAFGKIFDQQCLEYEMTSEFQSTNSKTTRNFREGHLKKSFIYLLLDPRVSENLPAQQNHLFSHELWKRFLSSIFYVGKGKSSRPYCHLYDAMKLYHQQEIASAREEESAAFYDHGATTTGGELMVEEEQIIFQCTEQRSTINLDSGGHTNRRHCQMSKITHRRRHKTADSQKLNRIIDVWCAGKGVVCLHVFHNIIPAEAYTREAAIIDALGVQNLTNLKRGDYYGQTVSWPMKKRKQLGILLLYKAMLIFLAEGETQLLPNDLI